MTSATPDKLFVLMSTSTISLNDRFSQLQTVEVSCDMSVLPLRRDVSHFNHCLALHMENRPSVLEALGKRGVKQRLGKPSVLKARLGRPARFRDWTFLYGRMGFRYRRQRGSRFQRTISATKSFGHLPNRLGWAKLVLPQALEMRGGLAISRGALVCRLDQRGKRKQYVRGGMNQGVWSRGGGWASSTTRRPQVITKEELDKQLDDYMSVSKSRLDAELDTYMAMAGDE